MTSMQTPWRARAAYSRMPSSPWATLSLTSTSLPARIMGLTDRGLIREGMAADLVVFDLNTIRDKATFFEPHQYSEGVDYVFVNGVAVVDGSKITWALPGKVISGQER